MITVIAVVALAAIGAVGAVVSASRDGYRRIPTTR